MRAGMIYAVNRAVIDIQLAQLIRAVEVYRPTRRYREHFDDAAQHYRAARRLVHCQTKDAEIAAALWEKHLGDCRLYAAKSSPERLLGHMEKVWEKFHGRG